MNKELIAKAFSEDLPQGDITTDSLMISEKFGIANIIAKQQLILSGTEVFTECFKFVNSEVELTWFFKDGDTCLNQQTVCQIEGNLTDIIKAERVALNFLGYLSGIATQTNQYVKACGNSKTKILDTRKTLPLYRKLSKQAVQHGGGTNHRMNLSDGVLIKENHIALAGGLNQCFSKIKAQTNLPIEMETKNIAEVQSAVDLGVDRIMLDNMSLKEMQSCLEIIPSSIETEASGNMTLDRIPKVAEIGPTYISVGALTHSVGNADFSLLFQWND